MLIYYLYNVYNIINKFIYYYYNENTFFFFFSVNLFYKLLEKNYNLNIIFIQMY